MNINDMNTNDMNTNDMNTNDKIDTKDKDKHAKL